MGVLAGVLTLAMNWLVIWALPQVLNVAPILPNWSDDTGLALLGGRQLIGAAAAAVNNASAILFFPVMIVALTRLVVRKTWLAVGLFLLFFVVAAMPHMASPVPHLIGTSLVFALFFFVLFRFGFLACAALTLTTHLAHDLPITPDSSSWFFSSTIFTLALIAALALYGFKIALPRRATVRDGS